MKFSIIVPVYNTEKYVLRCLESIAKQTYENYEVIIINDGSYDNSLKLIKNYIKDKVKFEVITQNNAGLSVARNNGIKKVTGDYILFVDSDDYLELDLLNNLNSKLKEKSVDVLKYNLKIITPNKKTVNKSYSFTNLKFDEAINLLLQDKYWEPAWLYCFKTSFWQKYNFNFTPGKLHEDFGLIPLVLMAAESISSYDFIGYNYVLRENSITNNITREKAWQKFNDTLYFYRTNLSIIDNCYNIDIDTKKFLKSFYANGIINRAKDLNYQDVKKSLKIMKTIGVFDNLIADSIKHKLKKVIYKSFPNLLIRGQK